MDNSAEQQGHSDLIDRVEPELERLRGIHLQTHADLSGFDLFILDPSAPMWPATFSINLNPFKYEGVFVMLLPTQIAHTLAADFPATSHSGEMDLQAPIPAGGHRIFSVTSNSLCVTLRLPMSTHVGQA